MAQVNVEMVGAIRSREGFIVLPKRWVIKHTFAWLGQCRRLAKDWENLNRRGLAIPYSRASIQVHAEKLCSPT